MADAGYIAFYVLLYVGVVLLLRSRVRSIGGTLWLDGITAALAAAALGAAVLVELVLENTEGSTSTVVTNLAYPLGDVLLLSAVFGVFSLTGWRPGPRWLVLGLGILATTAADAIYLFQSSNGTYVEGTWVDILWPTAMLLIASSAWLARPHARGARGRGPAAPRGTRSLRARRDGHPRLRPLHAAEPARDHPGVVDARCGHRATRLDVPREPPPASS